MTYRQANITTFAYDPWTPVRLEPVITGVPPGTATHFEPNGGVMPPGLTMDPDTGVVTGLSTDVGIGFRTSFHVIFRANGFTDALLVEQKVAFDGLGFTEAAGGGFALASPNTFTGVTGVTGVPGTLTFKVGHTILTEDRNLLAQPLPADTTVVYGIAQTTAPGASIDPATGVFTWTPTSPNIYFVQVIADVTHNGVTRRATSGMFTIVVN